MKIWIDNDTPAPEGYIGTESVAEASLWVVLGEAFGITASADNDINGVRKWKISEINIPNNENTISEMRAWLAESGRSYPVCVH